MNCFICGDPSKTRNCICGVCKDKRVVELGGGDSAHQNRHLRKMSRYINLDRIKYCDKTFDADFEVMSSMAPADFIFSSHCFEHIHNLKDLLNTCWHALEESKGVLEVVVPHRDSDKAYSIDHVRWFTRETFRGLTYSDIEDYGYQPWKILYLEGEKDENNQPEIRCRMTPVV